MSTRRSDRALFGLAGSAARVIAIVAVVIAGVTLMAGCGHDAPQAALDAERDDAAGEVETTYATPVAHDAPREAVVFGEESLIAEDERIYFSRSVNFAPADGQVVTLNPPRFRWRYHPTRPGGGGSYQFTFQVASDRLFQNRIVDLETEFNFYNTIAPFPGSGPYYWRIGYSDNLDPDSPVQWSDVRTFTVAPDAQVWDRSMLAEPDFASKGHPRILFNDETLPRLQEMVRTHPESRIIFDGIRARADRVLETDWYQNMPTTDTEPLDYGWVEASAALARVAFVWRVTGDDKYAGVKDRAVTMARYPKGGRSSPQPIGDQDKRSTQVTENLGLVYDWVYNDLTEAERRDFAASLDWRIDAFINGFGWRVIRDGVPVTVGGSISVTGGSHPYEGTFVTFPATLAVYEDSPAAREAFHLGLNYMIGVSSAHGYDEGWNEGPGYGNSKWSWLVNSMSYLDSIFPEFEIGANPWLIRMGEFMRTITPVGHKYAPWGHHGNRTHYIESGHRRNYRKLAYLTGDGRFLANWFHYGSVDGPLERPWIECAIPLWRERPEPVIEEDTINAFPLGGWVTALSGPPNDPDTYREGVSIVFASRPDGAWSHAFACDNSFHIYAYGQDITHAAGSSGTTPYAYSTMSHNSILVDGLGQAQLRSGQNIPYHGRIMAFRKADDVAYWCGDATMSYPREAQARVHWWGRLDDVYERMSLEHVTRVNRHVLFVRDRYFVILDDLEARQPSLWTWLYHVLESDRFDLDEHSGSFSYTIGGVDVKVTHLVGAGEVDASDRRGELGYINPITGEDYSDNEGSGGGRTPELKAEHNVWVTTREPHERWRFLSVVYPVPPGGQAPVIERLDDLTLKVTWGDDVDRISFDAGTQHDANIIVDLDAISKVGSH